MMLPARRALVSVSDKRGLEELARGLHRLGVEIVSTGGTLDFLRRQGIAAVAVADVTGFPEILDGRVKTLHPKIHGGILAKRTSADHAEQLDAHGIGRIDLVVVNLYPFRETVASGAAFPDVIEMIDIGGPAMVRAAAKNFAGVAVVVDPDDYPRLLESLAQCDGVVPEPLRRELALKAFQHTAGYDAAVAGWLAANTGGPAAAGARDAAGTPGAIATPGAVAPTGGAATPGTAPMPGTAITAGAAGTPGAVATPSRAATPGAAPTPGAEPAPGSAPSPGPASTPDSKSSLFPPHLQLDLQRTMELRYGENPHQAGAVYSTSGGPGALGGFRQLGGKELSWNNLLDADAAVRIVSQFSAPAVVIVKHNNPCGVGRGADLVEAYGRALATDPVSAFGSIIALNRPADGRLAEAMASLFVEVLLAPGYDEEARRRFGEKKNLRLLEAPLYQPLPGEVELRAIRGGFLAQPPDALPDDPAAWTCPTRRSPTAEERHALELAWDVARYVKSNAIVVANGDQTIGVGAGQMSRVDSCRLAIEKAQLPVAGAVAASDAFFPFRDGLDLLAGAGITAVVQPGGSKRDDLVVAAADEHGMAMLFTGTRHFRH